MPCRACVFVGAYFLSHFSRCLSSSCSLPPSLSADVIDSYCCVMLNCLLLLFRFLLRSFVHDATLSSPKQTLRESICLQNASDAHRKGEATTTRKQPKRKGTCNQKTSRHIEAPQQTRSPQVQNSDTYKTHTHNRNNDGQRAKSKFLFGGGREETNAHVNGFKMCLRQRAS